jgi:hypothetical protein
METQFTRKTGIFGNTGNYSITYFAGFTSFAVISGNTRKYGIAGKSDVKMFEVLLRSADN